MYIYHTGQKKVCADMLTAISHPPWTTKKNKSLPSDKPARRRISLSK